MKKSELTCKYCKIKTCHVGVLCAPLEWVDGDKPRKERLIENLKDTNIISERNYNGCETVL